MDFRLKRTVAAILILAVTRTLSAQKKPAQDERAVTIHIQIDTKAAGGRISAGFIGFGYEKSAVAQPDFFSPKNTRLVRLYRNLSTRGMIRIGGNVSDHTQYVPDGVAAAHTEREVTIINRKNIADLAAFARATGWSVMWGLNLGTGSSEEAVREAVDVSEALGNHLYSFEIGNEVEALSRFGRNYTAYFAAYKDYRAAITSAVPNAPFSGPDSIGDIDWIGKFATTEAGRIKLLTQHYYRGWAGDPTSTLNKLLQGDITLEDRLEKLQHIGLDNKIAFRINEVNSYSGGGKPGVSDTFGSALWCLDYMFRLASHGCAGVNMETDINQLGFISHYSPIVHDSAGNCTTRPEYYGILAFAMTGRGDLLKLDSDKGDINLSAYATRYKSVIWVTVINKEMARNANIEIPLPDGYSRAEIYRLRAPSIESKTEVTLAGTEVSEDGRWVPSHAEKIAVTEHTARVPVPYAGAALIRLSQ